MPFKIPGTKLALKKEIAVILASVLVLACLAGGYFIKKGTDGVIIETGGNQPAANDEKYSQNGQAAGRQEGSGSNTGASLINTPAYDDPAKSTGEAPEAPEIKIYVTGCVNKPGIVILKKGQIIDDAIRLAGGFTSDADLGNINLVYELKENLMLHVMSVKEGQEAADSTSGANPDPGVKPGTAGQAVQDAGRSEPGGKGVRITRDSGGAVVNSSEDTVTAASKVNINTADEKELDTLPGIGAATAIDIISYRENTGPFDTIEDIMKVPGIKESRFAKLRDLITVD